MHVVPRQKRKTLGVMRTRAFARTRKKDKRREEGSRSTLFTIGRSVYEKSIVAPPSKGRGGSLVR